MLDNRKARETDWLAQLQKSQLEIETLKEKNAELQEQIDEMQHRFNDKAEQWSLTETSLKQQLKEAIKTPKVQATDSSTQQKEEQITFLEGQIEGLKAYQQQIFSDHATELKEQKIESDSIVAQLKRDCALFEQKVEQKDR